MVLDAVELEIVSRKLSAITDEMYFAIQRASRSAYVKEAADFATAIQLGATHVRIGSAIFGGRSKTP